MGEKTIFALATPIGGAIAIIRISGERALTILKAIFKGKIKHSYLSYGKIHDGDTVIDEIMAVYFKAPHSYTGEDMVELHIHSSVAVCNLVMELLLKHNAFPASAGEFSRRAFLNGKMKLSEAEAVMDLINATAKRSASSAILQLSGALSKRIGDIENMLVDALSQIDAVIDYPDEMDDGEENVKHYLQNAYSSINELLDGGMKAHYLRDGFTIAIVGKPNVGKSSLLNTLIAQDKAIVTHVAGTTRDVIEAKTSFCGLPVNIFDTAGLHDTKDEVEKIGIQRTRDIMEHTDLIYVAFDISKPLCEADYQLLQETCGKPRIIVLCKSDIEHTVPSFSGGETVCAVSSNTGAGIEQLKRITASYICPDDESGIITNMRHIDALTRAKSALSDAICAIEPDCIATDIQRALHCVSEITGNAVDENVLDRIFERFCVGK